MKIHKPSVVLALFMFCISVGLFHLYWKNNQPPFRHISPDKSGNDRNGDAKKAEFVSESLPSKENKNESDILSSSKSSDAARHANYQDLDYKELRELYDAFWTDKQFKSMLQRMNEKDYDVTLIQTLGQNPYDDHQDLIIGAFLNALKSKQLSDAETSYVFMAFANYWRTADEIQQTEMISQAFETLNQGGDVQDRAMAFLANRGAEQAQAVKDHFGDSLRGHPMEIDVLNRIPGEASKQRLWEIHLQNPVQAKRLDSFNQHAKIARILMSMADKRGVGLAIDLLDSKIAPNHLQYRVNLYNSIAGSLGENVDLPKSIQKKDFDAAYAQLKEYWQWHKDSFVFNQNP